MLHHRPRHKGAETILGILLGAAIVIGATWLLFAQAPQGGAPGGRGAAAGEGVE